MAAKAKRRPHVGDACEFCGGTLWLLITGILHCDSCDATVRVYGFPV